MKTTVKATLVLITTVAASIVIKQHFAAGIANTQTCTEVNCESSLIQLPNEIVVEQAFILKLDSKIAENALVTGIIEGQSMYMGTIPLQWQFVEGQWQAQAILGACSEQNMRWQVKVSVNGQSYQQSFTSHWPVN